MKKLSFFLFKYEYQLMIIRIIHILMNLPYTTLQKCEIYDVNLHQIMLNKNNFNTIDYICSNLTNNDNSYCQNIISSCVCKEFYYGNSCQEKLDKIGIIASGISSSDFNLMILLILLIFTLILTIGFFVIWITFKDKLNESFKKYSNKRRKNSTEQGQTYKKDFEMIKYTNTTNNEKLVNNDNTNNLIYKKEINENNITENNRTEDIYKYSQIPITTERKDENMLITLRNNTELDNDTSVYKKPGLRDLNRNINDEFYSDIQYKRKMDKVEEFVSEFKSSLQETYGEEENFMVFSDEIFTNIENSLVEKKQENKIIFNKTKNDLQKIFNRLNDTVPNGKNYIKSNNFFNRYQEIFNIPSSDSYNFDTSDRLNEESNEIKGKGRNIDISFNKDKNIEYKKDILIEENKIVLDLNDNKKLENTEVSYEKDAKNEILNVKSRVNKKVFAIKSVEIFKNKIKSNNKENTPSIQSVDLGNKNLLHQRVESNKYQTYQNVKKKEDLD